MGQAGLWCYSGHLYPYWFFCSLALSVSEKGVLKSSSKIVGVSGLPGKGYQFLSMYCEACGWVHINVRLLHFLGELTFFHSIISSLSLIIFSVMKSALSKINVNTFLVYTWNIFLHSFIFHLSRSFLKWVAHILHIFESFFFVLSILILCLLYLDHSHERCGWIKVYHFN